MNFMELETCVNKIPDIASAIEEISKKIELFLPDLSQKRQVLGFLNVTEPTLKKYIHNGTLKEKIHYSYRGKHMVFVADEIIKIKLLGGLKAIKVEEDPYGIVVKKLNL